MRKPAFLFLLTFLFRVSLSGQQYNFHNYSVADGLAQSQVHALCEDARGYLWLGTRGGGLSRFDGQQFRTFTEDDSLSSNFINSITSDAAGTIWVGTDDGVCSYDGGKFQKLHYEGEHSPVNAILFAKDGSMWVGTSNAGLLVFENNKVQTRYTSENGLPNDQVRCLYEDKDGSMWVGLESGVVHIKGSYRKTYSKKENLPSTSIRAIIRDGKNRLWFATYGDGLCYFNDTNLFRKFTVENGLSNNTTHCMSVDESGRLWVGTASGVTRIDGDEVKLFSEHEGLCSNVVMSLLEDSWGNTWFGTSGGGACMLDGERFIHFNEKSGDMGTWVYALHCDRKGHLWFGTSRGGVTEYDGHYYTPYYEGAGFTSAKVRSFGEDTSGTLWFGTVGEGAYSLKNGSFKHYTRANGLSGSYINAFLTDRRNHEWMATAGAGISIFDPQTEKFERVNAKQGLTNDRITAMAMDDGGSVWACSTGGGIYYIQYDSAEVTFIRQYTTKEGLPGNTARCVAKDRFGNMWFGFAGGGLSRHATPVPEDLTPHFRNYSKKNGLASDNIYLLTCDHEGNLWAGTEKGLDKITYNENGDILSVKHYGKGEGFNGIETSLNASCLDTNGGVWFGTINGASVYHSKNDFINKEPPRIHLTGIRLFFDPIENTPYWNPSTKKSWFPVPDSLKLPYTENHLRFEFTGIDLRNPEGVRFKWMLIGFDKTWTPENNERQATYSNLPPGDYSFAVQAKNSDGFWSSINYFHFTITPPVWETWPFRIGAASFVLLLIVLVFSWRVRLIKRKTKRQLEKVTLEKHVLELEQKALRLQMNPHFIFNALQSIQGFIARNDSAEARRYLAKFGKLMRLTLENSRQAYTSIAQEAESLEYYLGLEALCHGNRFTYAVFIDERIDAEATFIPVMLIQPFVENAVIHGMLHLGEKQGKIDIRFLLDGKSVVCEVEDNGVGRQKAAEFESESKKDHKSAALEITRERLAQVNEKGKPQSSLEIIDLHHADGSASGTKVVIRIGNVVFE